MYDYMMPRLVGMQPAALNTVSVLMRNSDLNLRIPVLIISRSMLGRARGNMSSL